MIQLPSVGRIVHYYTDDRTDQPMAAIVTGVFEGDEKLSVDLSVFQRKLPSPLIGVKVPFSDTLKRGHWSWPPRV